MYKEEGILELGEYELWKENKEEYVIEKRKVVI